MQLPVDLKRDDWEFLCRVLHNFSTGDTDKHFKAQKLGNIFAERLQKLRRSKEKTYYEKLEV